MSIAAPLTSDPITSVVEEKQVPYYSNDVLMGNWYEQRLTQKVDRRAIVPAVYGQSGCTQELSSYQRSFVVPHPDIDKAADEFIDLSQDAFANGLGGRSSNVLFFNGDDFIKNMTTTTDIMYNIRVKARIKAQQEEEESIMPKKLPREDFLKSYGNSTQTGLRKWMALRECCQEKMPVGSTYRREYGPKPRLISKTLW